MSSTQEGSSGMATSKRKPERNRRSWTQQEETLLLAAMKEIIAQGWKSDNGFRTGYHHRLAKMISKQLPTTDIKAFPHVHSKITAWKKSYNSLNAILSRSGVGWNLKGNFMFEVEDDQFEQIKTVDANARLMRFKQWPLYDDWKEVFGSDRATGEMAEDIAEASADFYMNEPEMPADDDEMSVDLEEDEGAGDTLSQNAKSDLPKQTGKKRKMSEDIIAVCELLHEMNRGNNSRLDKVANRMGSEFDMGKARQETLNQLRQILGLSRADMYIVLELIAFKVERLEIWKGMDKDARAEYVDHLLETRNLQT